MFLSRGSASLCQMALFTVQGQTLPADVCLQLLRGASPQHITCTLAYRPTLNRRKVAHSDAPKEPRYSDSESCTTATNAQIRRCKWRRTLLQPSMKRLTIHGVIAFDFDFSTIEHSTLYTFPTSTIVQTVPRTRRRRLWPPTEPESHMKAGHATATTSLGLLADHSSVPNLKCAKRAKCSQSITPS